MRVYPLTKELCLKVDNFFDAITRKTKLNETTVVVAMIVYIKLKGCNVFKSQLNYELNFTVVQCLAFSCTMRGALVKDVRVSAFIHVSRLQGFKFRV